MTKLTWTQFCTRLHNSLADEGLQLGPMQTAFVAEITLKDLWTAVQGRYSVRTPVGTFEPAQRATRRYRVPSTGDYVVRTGPLRIKHTPKPQE